MLRLITLVVMIFSITSGVYADAKLTQNPQVLSFIHQMVKKHHFKRAELIALFNDVKIRHRVLRNIKKPLETIDWATYQMLFVNEWRIEHGVKFWNKHAEALKKAEKKFNVPAGLIVATIGVETKYGQKLGEYRVIDSLSSLAFSHNRRAPYFRSELEHFLLLTREQHLDPHKIRGSYAGAIGQGQFMPSSYRYYGINFSKNGKLDLIHNDTDVIGSIANYYSKNGWKDKQPIAVPAAIVGGSYTYFLRNNNLKQAYTFNQLAKYGITPKHVTGQKDMRVKLIELSKQNSKEYWLGYKNFDVIKRYNPSDLYAMVIYQLSKYITTLRERLNNG